VNIIEKLKSPNSQNHAESRNKEKNSMNLGQGKELQISAIHGVCGLEIINRLVRRNLSSYDPHKEIPREMPRNQQTENQTKIP
jgi:hypothetical protein